MLFQSKRRITSIEKTKDVEYSVVAIGIYRYDTVIFALRQVKFSLIVKVVENISPLYFAKAKDSGLCFSFAKASFIYFDL